MVSEPSLPGGSRAAVFLDRDGVIVVPEFRDGRSYAPRTIEAFSIYDSAAHELARLKAAGYLLIVVTNQPDVGRGIVPPEVLDEMHRRIEAELPIDLISACIHEETDSCACRKPKPGMLLAAAEEFEIDLASSIMVGDRASDVEAGAAAGCRTVFIDLGYREQKPVASTLTVRSLGEAVDGILKLGLRVGSGE
jgi:D-glycero-D-manno-heptose 1,7-bisphosphate phosphatase